MRGPTASLSQRARLMARVGINVSRDGRHDAAWIRTFNARGARIVLTAEHDLRARFEDYRQHGVFILAVLARESFAGFGPVRESDGYPLDNTARAAAAYYRDLYDHYLAAGHGAIQVGNEPDHASPSSWTLRPDDLSALGWGARAMFPEATLVCAGMTSGDPSYLDHVDLRPFNALAGHFYAKDAPNPDDVEDLPDVTTLVPAYRAFGLPLWQTEWGWWGSEERGRHEVGDMTAWARDTDELEWHFHFCADDVMVAPFGLLRTDGSWKPAAEAFFAAMDADTPDEPVPVEPDIWIGDGILDALQKTGLAPASGEYPWHVVDCANGTRLAWDSSNGQIYRIKASALKVVE